jgi:hypothetical protein
MLEISRPLSLGAARRVLSDAMEDIAKLDPDGNNWDFQFAAFVNGRGLYHKKIIICTLFRNLPFARSFGNGTGKGLPLFASQALCNDHPLGLYKGYTTRLKVIEMLIYTQNRGLVHYIGAREHSGGGGGLLGLNIHELQDVSIVFSRVQS